MKCKNCGKEVKENWKVCPWCKTALEKPINKCPNCGEEVDDSWDVCPACEYPLHVSENFDIENGVLVKYKGKGENPVIPNSVTSIGNAAFCWCSSITSIIIPNSVTSIGDFAFKWCRNLASVTIPDSVTSIGEKAFLLCSLRTVTLSKKCKVGEDAFDSSCKVIRR